MEIKHLIPEPKIRNLFGPFDNKEYYFNLGKEQAEKIIQCLSIRPEDKILDVGCGCGRLAIHFLNYLSEQGKYIGIDINKYFISYCVILSNSIIGFSDPAGIATYINDFCMEKLSSTCFRRVPINLIEIYKKWKRFGKYRIDKINTYKLLNY